MEAPDTAFAVYFALSIVATAAAGWILGRDGATVLRKLAGDELARAVGRLVQVGFYLVTVGFMAVWLGDDVPPVTAGEITESIATNVGGVLVFGGLAYLFSLLVLGVFAKRAEPRRHDLPQATPERPAV